MTQIPDTPPAPPTATDALRFSLLDVSGLLHAVEVAADALDGDGSTSTMPDVTPDQAARWMLAALDAAGFVLVKRAEQ